MNVNDSRMADYLAAIDTELELFGSRWPCASYEGAMRHSSHFFHRDPADAFYTDRDEDDAPPECPYCRDYLMLVDARYQCDCTPVTYASRAEVKREAATMAAFPFSIDNVP